MALGVLIAIIAALFVLFVGLIVIIGFAGVIEGRLPPEKQGRP